MVGDIESRLMTTLQGIRRAWLNCVLLLLVSAGFNTPPVLHAQTGQSNVSLEVVSIKISAPDCTLVMIGPSDDGFHLHCVTLVQLVKYAFGLNLSEESNVFGLPK